MRVTSAICIACGVSACGPAATEGGFDSANSAAKMYAVEDAARTGDRDAIRNLIEQLDSDDPAVRFMAISTLERLTGETFGFRHYDSAIDRRDAIARWVDAYKAHAIVPMSSSPPPNSAAFPINAEPSVDTPNG